MKTTIEYSTFCEATVREKNGDSWGYHYTFQNLKSAIDWAENEINVRLARFDVEKIFITDCETGELLAICEPDDDDAPEYDCDWGYNEDMGFDPYMGCYSDDC